MEWNEMQMSQVIGSGSNMRPPIRKIKPDLKAGVIQWNKTDSQGWALDSEGAEIEMYKEANEGVVIWRTMWFM